MANIDLENGRLLVAMASPYDIGYIAHTGYLTEGYVPPISHVNNFNDAFDTINFGLHEKVMRVGGEGAVLGTYIDGRIDDDWKASEQEPRSDYVYPIPFAIFDNKEAIAKVFVDGVEHERFAYDKVGFLRRDVLRQIDDSFFDQDPGKYDASIAKFHKAMQYIGQRARYVRPRLADGSVISDDTMVTLPVYNEKTNLFVDVTEKWSIWEPYVIQAVQSAYVDYLKSYKYEAKDGTEEGPFTEDPKPTNSSWYSKYWVKYVGFELFESVPSNTDDGAGGSGGGSSGSTGGGSSGGVIIDEDDSDLWEDAVKAMESYDKEQAIQLKLATEGLATKFSIARPDETVHSGLTQEERIKTDEWWESKERIWTNVINVNAENSGKALSSFEKAQTEGSTTAPNIDMFKQEHEAAEKLALEENPKSWLNTLWESLGDVTSYVGDVIKDWGPTSIIGAWAGYEAIKSAKNSSIPPWLIIGGVGLLALLIIK